MLIQYFLSVTGRIPWPANIDHWYRWSIFNLFPSTNHSDDKIAMINLIYQVSMNQILSVPRWSMVMELDAKMYHLKPPLTVITLSCGSLFSCQRVWVWEGSIMWKTAAACTTFLAMSFIFVDAKSGSIPWRLPRFLYNAIHGKTWWAIIGRLCLSIERSKIDNNGE